MRGRKALFLAFTLWILAGCAPSMKVERMEPIRLPHTYSVILLTRQPPTEVQWKLLGKMEETLNFEQMLNVVYLPQVEYFDGSPQTVKLLATSGADTLVLFRRLDLLQTGSGYRLVAKMSFLGISNVPSEASRPREPGLASVAPFVLEGDRSSSVELNQRVPLGEAINLLGTRLALEVSDQIVPAEDAQFAPYIAPPGGPAGMGEEGDF